MSFILELSPSESINEIERTCKFIAEEYPYGHVFTLEKYINNSVVYQGVTSELQKIFQVL